MQKKLNLSAAAKKIILKMRESVPREGKQSQPKQAA